MCKDLNLPVHEMPEEFLVEKKIICRNLPPNKEGESYNAPFFRLYKGGDHEIMSTSTQNEREDSEELSTQQIQDSIYKEMAAQVLRTKGMSRAEL